MSARPAPLDLDNWSIQLRKGVLELCIVNMLSQGEMYGYDLVKRLAHVEGMAVPEGTIYPLLSRLNRAGLVETRLEESTSGPARKYYSLSASGRRACAQMNLVWLDVVNGVNDLIANEKEHPHD
jgi:PadR family transcriptional regulator, regulatory protein PadR